MPASLKQKTVNGLVWSTVERFSVQGISFVLGLLIARMLSPSDYGVLAMLSIFISVSSTFVDSGFSSALIRKTDRTEADNSTVFYFNIVVGIAFYAILFFCAPFIADFYNTPILVPITRVVTLTLVLGSFCTVQQALFTAHINFKTQAKVSFSATLLSGITGVVMAYFGFGVWALVAQTLVASIIRTILFWWYSKWRPILIFSKKSFHELFSFGSKLLASGLLDTIYNNLYTIIIGKLFSAHNLGLYSRASQFSQFPSSNITGIIQRVTFPVLSTIQDEDDRLRQDYRLIIRLSGFIVFPMMTGLSAISEPLINVLLTSKWAGCVIYLQIICFAMMWYPIHAINLNLLQVKGRSDLFLRLEIIKKILGVSILCITVPMGLLTMCYGQIFSSIICLIINTHYTGKLINVGFLRQMRDLMPSLINSLIMGLIVYFSLLLVSSMILKLIIGIVIGAVYYIAINYITKSKELKYLMNIIHRR